MPKSKKRQVIKYKDLLTLDKENIGIKFKGRVVWLKEIEQAIRCQEAIGIYEMLQHVASNPKFGPVAMLNLMQISKELFQKDLEKELLEKIT